MNSSPRRARTSSVLHLLIGGLPVALASAAAWFGWLGWDDEYWIDSDGVLQGPYETWQVVGCVLTLLAVGIVAARWWSAWGIVAVMPLAFTVAWSVTSAPGDDSGLWVVGAFLVLVGMTVACLVVAAAVRSWANRVVG